MTTAAENLSPTESLAEVERLRCANKDLAQSERGKSVLLSISAAITAIRDKNELWQVMMDKVQPLLNLKAAVSTVFSSDHSQYRYLLFSGVLMENLSVN